VNAPRRRFSLARHRLKSGDFARVYRSGRRAQGGSFAVVVLENGRGHSRLGLSVSKRHARSAVARNRVRRVLREAFRLSLDALPAGLDVVLVATAPGLAPRLAETRAELVHLVERARAKRPRRAPDEVRPG
jgi:ribonuclease P protein component